MINKLISKSQVTTLGVEHMDGENEDYNRGYNRAIIDVLELTPIPTFGADEVRRMLADIHAKGVMIVGEGHGYYVRYSDVERIINGYAGGGEK